MVGMASTPYFTQHDRTWQNNVYVYPVISRRSGGLSIGVNLNPDKACNFDCVYCQVDRTVAPTVREVDPRRLRDELERTVRAAVSGELFTDPHFRDVPAAYRRISDIAFSGDGEPTTSPLFGEAVHIAADIRQTFNLPDLKLVLITDAAYLTKPAVRAALAVMDANNGEIWAKLDAGTEEYYQLINRPNVPLQTVLDNILDAAKVRPVVIQSLWMKVHGQPPPLAEIDAFARCLQDILRAGGQIRLVQVYTIARRTTEPFVTPLEESDLQAIADRVQAVTQVPVTIYT